MTKENDCVQKGNDFSRLPSNIIPTHYSLTIKPDIDSFTISGTEIVSVDVREKTNFIVLNFLGIQIHSASFVSNEDENPSTNIELNKELEIAIITFEKELDLGSGKLNLKFTSKINENLHGCYRCKYVTPEGEVRYGLSTQFESVYCRQVFPCWDEPSLKAKFDLTLVAPKDRVALSNMNVVEESDFENDKTKKVVKFATTPIMSTYLLCFIIGEYEFVEKFTKNGVRIRVYTLLSKSEQGQLALDVAVSCLEYFENFFGIPFPLPKMDLIAISDFESGAMENWGLITFRETCILYDPQNSSLASKQYIILVTCHEIAHQWFGNLVTMEWWTHLWLNEGFATFMEYLAADYLFPELKLWQNFVNFSLIPALNLDYLDNSHPIEVPVNHPHEIEEIFDQISYEKGSSAIRMLYNYIGEKDFQKGLHSYLTKWSFKNTVTEDLWDSLEEDSKKPVRAIMSTWTRQKGYPIVKLSTRQDGSNRIVTLSQEKFSLSGVLTEKEQQMKWLIPISLISQNNPKVINVLFENRTQEIVLENVEPNEWIKLNPNKTSFYLASYPIELFEQFKQSIADKSINPIDRLDIQYSLFLLVKSGKISSDYFFRLLESYVDEDEYIIWDSIFMNLRSFNHLLSYTDYQEVFHLYVRKLLAKIYAKIGNKPRPGEDHQISLLRQDLLLLLVSCKDPQVLQEAKEQFESHVSKLKLISPDLRDPIYRAIAGDCDDKTFDSFYELYRETDLHEEKNRILRCMSASTDPVRIQKLIDFAMSKEVRKQDVPSIFSALSAANKVSREIIWNYFKENYQIIIDNYKSGSCLSFLVRNLVSNFMTEEHVQDVSSFFSTHPVECAERVINQKLEETKLKINWLSRDSAVIKNYLTSYKL